MYITWRYSLFISTFWCNMFQFMWSQNPWIIQLSCYLKTTHKAVIQWTCLKPGSQWTCWTDSPPINNNQARSNLGWYVSGMHRVKQLVWPITIETNLQYNENRSTLWQVNHHRMIWESWEVHSSPKEVHIDFIQLSRWPRVTDPDPDHGSWPGLGVSDPCAKHLEKGVDETFSLGCINW